MALQYSICDMGTTKAQGCHAADCGLDERCTMRTSRRVRSGCSGTGTKLEFYISASKAVGNWSSWADTQMM